MIRFLYSTALFIYFISDNQKLMRIARCQLLPALIDCLDYIYTQTNGYLLDKMIQNAEYIEYPDDLDKDSIVVP